MRRPRASMYLMLVARRLLSRSAGCRTLLLIVVSLEKAAWILESCDAAVFFRAFSHLALLFTPCHRPACPPPPRPAPLQCDAASPIAAAQARGGVDILRIRDRPMLRQPPSPPSSSSSARTHRCVHSSDAPFPFAGNSRPVDAPIPSALTHASCDDTCMPTVASYFKTVLAVSRPFSASCVTSTSSAGAQSDARPPPRRPTSAPRRASAAPQDRALGVVAGLRRLAR